MTKWISTLNIKDIWEPFNEKVIDGNATREETKAFLEVLISRIKKLPFYAEPENCTDNRSEELGMIVDNFEDLRNHCMDVQILDPIGDFNGFWTEFYDWADQNRVWVNIF